MGAKIKGDTTVSEDSLFRLGSFSINNKKVDVPLQAFDLNKQYKSPVKIPSTNIFACEIFRSFTPEKLQKIQKDGIFQGKDESEVKRIFSSSGNGTLPCFLFTSFEGMRFPNSEEIKDLINISYPYSDAVPIPALPDVFKRQYERTNRKGETVTEIKTKGVDEEQFNAYLAFLENFIDKVKDWNHKDILGIIPTYFGSMQVRQLINFYYAKGVHHYYFDFNTRMFNTMLNSQMINFITTLKEVGLEYQKTFIYAINNSPGKFTKNDDAIPSKDILTPGAGMDCVGKLHVGGGGSNKNKDERVKNKLIRNRFSPSAARTLPALAGR